LTIDALQIRRLRHCRFVLTVAFAAWIGCTDLLATSVVGESGASQSVRSQSHFRLTRGVLPPQLCRFNPSPLSARTIELTEEEQEKSDEDSRGPTIAVRRKSQGFASETISFRIAAPDHLIELPGTPPPAAHC
jgi:hypothetical protein